MRLRLTDGLSDDIFDQPLSLLFDTPHEWMNRSIRIVQDGTVIERLFVNTTRVTLSLKPEEGRDYVLIPE